ncbi:hypothetical protein ACJQWK_05357 [Exserohilum turcicum]
MSLAFLHHHVLLTLARSLVTLAILVYCLVHSPLFGPTHRPKMHTQVLTKLSHLPGQHAHTPTHTHTINTDASISPQNRSAAKKNERLNKTHGVYKQKATLNKEKEDKNKRQSQKKKRRETLFITTHILLRLTCTRPPTRTHPPLPSMPENPALYFITQDMLILACISAYPLPSLSPPPSCSSYNLPTPPLLLPLLLLAASPSGKKKENKKGGGNEMSIAKLRDKE